MEKTQFSKSKFQNHFRPVFAEELRKMFYGICVFCITVGMARFSTIRGPFFSFYGADAPRFRGPKTGRTPVVVANGTLQGVFLVLTFRFPSILFAPGEKVSLYLVAPPLGAVLYSTNSIFW